MTTEATEANPMTTEATEETTMTTETETFTIATATELRCLFQLVAKNSEVRWYLRGVLVDVEGENDDPIHLVSTNGHAMAVLPVELDPYGTAQLRTAVKAWCAKTGKPHLIIKPWKISTTRSAPPVSLTFYGGNAAQLVASQLLKQGQKQELLETIDGTFPAWRRVDVTDREVNADPANQNPAAVGVNPLYLSAFADGPLDHVRLDFGPEGANSPIKVTPTGSLGRVRGTVMPVRI